MKKNWNRLLAVLMALLIGLGSVDGALTSVLAYAEPMDALTTASSRRSGRSRRARRRPMRRSLPTPTRHRL